MTETGDHEESVAIFKKQWAAYQVLIKSNAIAHAEILEAYKAILSDPSVNTECVLDIGCGDCWMPFHLVRSGHLSCTRAFYGIDLSKAALDVAAANNPFKDNPSTLNLIVSDIDSYITGCSANTFDLAITSFVIHHWRTSEEKAALVKNIANTLKPNGRFIWCDVYNSSPDKPQREVVYSWEPRFRNVDGLSVEDSDRIWGHVSVHDYPEPLASMKEMMLDAGLVDIREEFLDADKDIPICCVLVGRKES